LQASTGDIYGGDEGTMIDENAKIRAQNPYALAKLYAQQVTGMYRRICGIYACSFLAFNHESPLRTPDFVTRKITLAAARISKGLQDCLYLGNMDSSRDWGYSVDYVEAYWKILNETKEATDYIVGTGISHTVREFATLAFKHVGVDIEWEGTGADERGRDPQTGKIVVKVDPQFFRPGVVKCHVADITKIKNELGWQPKTSFEDLVKVMMNYDLVFVVKQEALEKSLFEY